MSNPINFGLQGSKVKVNFDTVYKTLWARYRLQFFFSNLFQTSHASCG